MTSPTGQLSDEPKAARPHDRTASRPSLTAAWGREAGVFGALLFLCIALGLYDQFVAQRQVFLGPVNLQNLSRQIAFLGVFALGSAIVIIAGGIDLSVGSVIGFTGMLCARMFAEWHWS